MIKTLLRTALIAGAGAATTWYIKRALDQRAHAEGQRHTKLAIHDWENEGGGTVSSQPVHIDDDHTGPAVTRTPRLKSDVSNEPIRY